MGTETLLVVSDQSGNERGVPFAGSSTIMDLAGPATLAKLSQSEEGLIVQVCHLRAAPWLAPPTLVPSGAQHFVNHPSKSASASTFAGNLTQGVQSYTPDLS